MTRADAVNYAKSLIGQRVDFDGYANNQCVDLFNFIVKHLTGISPYNQGYGVKYAYELIDRVSPYFINIRNNPSDSNQLPQPGDLIVFASGFYGGIGGHVASVVSADALGVTVIEQNGDARASTTTLGSPVATRRYLWSVVGKWTLGWIEFKNYDKIDVIRTEQDMPVTRQDVIDIYMSIRHLPPSEEEINIHVSNKSQPMDVIRAFLSSEVPQIVQAEANEDAMQADLAEKLKDTELKVSALEIANEEKADKISELTSVPISESTPPVKSANKLVLRTASLSGLAVIVADIVTNYLIIMAGRFGVDIDPTAISEIKTFVTGTFIAMAIWIGQFAYKKGKKFIV